MINKTLTVHLFWIYFRLEKHILQVSLTQLLP